MTEQGSEGDVAKAARRHSRVVKVQAHTAGFQTIGRRGRAKRPVVFAPVLAEVEATKLLPNDRKELADDGWAGIVGVELEATAAAAYQRPKASAGSLSSSRSSSESTAQATTDGRGERALRVKSRFPKV